MKKFTVTQYKDEAPKVTRYGDWETEFNERFCNSINNDYLDSSDAVEIKSFIQSLLNTQCAEIIEIGEGLKEKLPSIKWKDEHEENVIKATKNATISAYQEVIKNHV